MEKYTYLENFNKKNSIGFNILEYTHNELYIINNILSKNNVDNIIETNNSNILNYIGLIYERKNKIEESKLYYLKAIELNNINAITNYAYLLGKEKKIEEAKEYYLMAINLNNSSAMYNYACLLKEENKKEEAKKYFLMSINLNNTNAMYNYAILLEEENKIEEAKEYFLMAIKLNDSDAMNNYINIEKSILKQYINLIKIKSEVAINYINEIKNNRDVIILSNKLKYNNKIDNCNICMEENKVNVLLSCYCHYMCEDCYYNLYNKPCPYCKL